MNHNLPGVEIGMCALFENQVHPITEKNLTSRTLDALTRHPENETEILLTSLIFYSEQEADLKLGLYLKRLAKGIEKQKQRVAW